MYLLSKFKTLLSSYETALIFKTSSFWKTQERKYFEPSKQVLVFQILSVANCFKPLCDNSGRCFCRTRKRAFRAARRQEKQTQILKEKTPDRFHGNKHSTTGHNTPGPILKLDFVFLLSSSILDFSRIIFGDYIVVCGWVDGVKEYCSSYPATLLDDTRMATLTSRKATLELTPFPPPNDTSLAP